MKTLKLFLVLFPLSVIFCNCGRIDTNVYGSADKMIARYESEVGFIGADELNAVIQTDSPHIMIVDVREPAEFEAGHIAGAINVPRGILEFSDRLTNRRAKVFLYSNNQNRSVLSALNLKLLKFRDVFVLQGGFEEWGNKFPDKVGEGPEANQVRVAAAPVKSGGCGD